MKLDATCGRSTGVDAESMAGAEPSGNRTLEGTTTQRKASSAEDGVPHIRDGHDSHPLSDRANRSATNLPTAERQRDAANVLATGGRVPALADAVSLIRCSSF
jgi:hypothetical protein